MGTKEQQEIKAINEWIAETVNRLNEDRKQYLLRIEELENRIGWLEFLEKERD